MTQKIDQAPDDESGLSKEVFEKNTRILGNPKKAYVAGSIDKYPVLQKQSLAPLSFFPAYPRNLKVVPKLYLPIRDFRGKKKLTPFQASMSGILGIAGHLGDSTWADGQHRVYGSGIYYLMFKFRLYCVARLLSTPITTKMERFAAGERAKHQPFPVIKKNPITGKYVGIQLPNIPISLYRGTSVKVGGNLPIGCHFGTRSAFELNVWYFSMYATKLLKSEKSFGQPRNFKTVPPFIKDLFWHPLSLFLWYMDDGYWSTGDKTIYISTGVSQEAAEYLVDTLAENFGVDVTIQYDNGEPKRFAIEKNGSVERFHSFIYPWCQLMLHYYPRVFSGERMFNKVIPPFTMEKRVYQRFSGSGPTYYLSIMLEPFNHPWQPLTDYTWLQTLPFDEAVEKLFFFQME